MPHDFDWRNRRTKLTGFAPGHIFWLPRGTTWLNRDKWRPYALATPCDARRTGTLVFGSTRETEKQAGAAYVEVAPIAVGVNANFLAASTFFYPAVMLRMAYADLPTHSGILGKSIGEFRSAIRTALGIGSGSCLRAGVPPKSRRGRIVMLEQGLAALFRTRFAVVLTEHTYSRQKNYQLIVPILHGKGRTADESVLVFRRKQWLDVFDEPADSALLPVQITQSVWYPDDIAHETTYVLDEDALAAIDSRLCDLFGLEPI